MNNDELDDELTQPQQMAALCDEIRALTMAVLWHGMKDGTYDVVMSSVTGVYGDLISRSIRRG
jgi:hypothetical protein